MSAAQLAIVLMLVAFAVIHLCAISPIQVKFKINMPNGLGPGRPNRFVRTRGGQNPAGKRGAAPIPG
jgi:hypothetical protein